MIDKKILNGILDADSSPYTIGQNSHFLAKNIRFPMQGTFLQAQNVKGNYIISNSNLPSGTNECIGSFFDQVNDVIYFFNYNSNGNNGLYKLTIQTETITQIFRCGVNSTTDILTFSRDYPVHSCAIIYQQSGDGDLLYWTDGLNPPKYLNLSTVSTLSPFTVDMLYASKMPPSVPPTVAYSSDATKNYNNVHNRYFRFAYRWVYANFEKSTFSPPSIVPQPTGITNPETNVAPNANNLITVAVNSGTTADFTDIEIYGQEFNGTTWGDFFLIQSINKANVGAIPFTYTFSFYNDGVYSTILPSESDLRFDYLPDVANTLELLNGNTIIYGGITEGYDKLTRSQIDVQVTTSLVGIPSLAVTKVWKWANNERLGLIYFDKRGKTNGVISFLDDPSIDTTNFDITTPQFPGTPSGTIIPQMPQISASINHLPPSWAVTYQWVRIDAAPPFFLEYLTNDYQTDNDYIYLCIQDLIYNNTATAFLPSYEFTEGDRVRVMGTMSFSGGAVTAFSTQYDFQILGVVERIMGGQYNTATNGSYLKCKKPISFPTPAYTQFMMIEIYTPPAKVNDTTAIFYEWGQEYAITGGYHMGQLQNQTASQPATFAWTNGYVYYKHRLILGVTGINLAFLDCVDRGYNDFQKSNASDNSRGWPIDVNAKQEYFPVTSRWGGSYIQDTNINNLNRFYPQDLDTIDRSKGDIRRFKQRDRILRVFQDRGVGQYGVYARYIQNNAGDSQLVTTNEIITTNNINYYQGVYGLCGYPTNLASNTNADYFTDIITGRAIRLSGDGLTDLGLLYKGQYYFPQLVLPYNKQLTRSNGSIAKVMGFFDSFDNQYHTILQGSTTTDPYNFSFNEDRNGFCSLYDIHAEWYTHADGVNYQWYGGNLYKQNSSVYCNFFGTQYNAEITLIFNQDITMKKSWQSIAQTASDVWISPTQGDIETDGISYGTTKQQSHLVAANYRVLESKPSTAFYRDENSNGGWVNGDFLKGSYLKIKLIKQNASSLISLSEAEIYFVISPLNLR